MSAWTVGKGWHPILDRLKSDLAALGYKGPIHAKEKYGTLRVEIGAARLEAHQRAEQAEDESSRTCETCGAPGTCVTLNGWMRTRCGSCP